MTTKTPENKNIYISGAQLLDPSQKLNRAGDLLVEKGKILAIGKPGELKAKAKTLKAEEVKGDGAFLSPGFIDLNCIVHEPGAEHIENFVTASHAAASGGFTSLLVKPLTSPVNDNAFMTDFLLRRARENSSVRIFPMGCLTAERDGKKLAEMGSMAAAGVRAVGDCASVSDSYLMRKGLEYSRAFSMPVFIFPDDKALSAQGVMHQSLSSNRLGLRGIPSAAEEIAVARDLILSRHTGGRVHFQSITTKGALDLIRKAKKDGLDCTAETNPQYFSLTCDSISTYDANFKFFPPLRMQEDVNAVIEALEDGTLDVIASSHTPQTRSSKEQAFEHASAGMVALETTISLALDLVNKKKISPLRLVELLSTNPASILGLNDLGSLKPGHKADLTLFDPKKKFTFEGKDIFSASRNTPFLGSKMQGLVLKTFVAGTVVYSRE